MHTSLRVMALLLVAASTAFAQIPLRPVPVADVSQPPPDSRATAATSAPPTVPLHRIVPKEIACPASFEDAAAAAGVRIFDGDSVSSPADVRTLGRREYPQSLERSGVGGRVVFRFVIDTLGHPEPCSFETMSATNKEFEAAAYRMVLGSTFRPAKNVGKVVPVRVSQAVNFNP